MKAVIVGCGRAGAVLAEDFDRAGYEVVIVDRSTAAFDKLSSTFKGNAIRGDGTDEDVLRRAGAEDADIFLTLTEGDNRNVMAAQLAVEALGARRVVAKVNDPLRAAAYADLGVATLCRTNLIEDAILSFLGLPSQERPGVQAARGQHHGGDHHHVETDELVETPGTLATVAAGSGGAAAGGSPAQTASDGGPGTAETAGSQATGSGSTQPGTEA
jgi:trk system potassium uptake protein TrkA